MTETLETTKRGKLLTEKHAQQVNVDTTVQEKAVAFSTDARLYHKALRILVRAAKERGIELRQSFERLGGRSSNKADTPMRVNSREQDQKLVS